MKIFVYETYGEGYGSQHTIVIAENETKAAGMLYDANFDNHGLIKTIDMTPGVYYIGGYVE